MRAIDDLYSEFQVLKDANDGRLLLALADRILDDHPRADEMLNCCGYIGAVTAGNDYPAVYRCSLILRRALAIAEGRQHWGQYAKTAGNLLMIFNQLGLFHEAGDLAERGQQICKEHSEAAQWLPYMWASLIYAHYSTARFAVAAGIANSALRDDIPFGLRQYVLILLAACYARLGKAESARAAWDLSTLLPGYEARHLTVQALVLAAERRHVEAREALVQSLEQWAKPGTLYFWLNHAEAYWLLAQLEEARGAGGATAYHEAAVATASPLVLPKIPLFAEPLPGAKADD